MVGTQEESLKVNLSVNTIMCERLGTTGRCEAISFLAGRDKIAIRYIYGSTSTNKRYWYSGEVKLSASSGYGEYT